MGPYLIDLSKLTEEERLQMQTAAAILEPLYRKAQLRITNGNANGNGNGNEHPSEHSASTVASGPDQADHVPVQHQSGTKPRSSRKAKPRGVRKSSVARRRGSRIRITTTTRTIC
jgi:hypothetical protein